MNGGIKFVETIVVEFDRILMVYVYIFVHSIKKFNVNQHCYLVEFKCVAAGNISLQS